MPHPHTYSDLTEVLTKLLGGRNDVRALWLRGSRAVGRELDGSDIDYTIIAAEGAAHDPIEAALGSILTRATMPAYLGDGQWPVWRLPAGDDVGIRIYAFGWLDHVVAGFYTEQDDFLEHMDLVQNVIVEARPLWHPEGLLASLRARVDTRPQTFLLAVAERLVARLENKLSTWLRDGRVARGPLQHVSDMWHVIREVVFAHYLINGEFSMNAMKRYYTGDADRFAPDIRDRLKVLVRTDWDLTNEREKMRALARVITEFRVRIDLLRGVRPRGGFPRHTPESSTH